jgi:predicted permease
VNAYLGAQSADGLGIVDFTPDWSVLAYAVTLAGASALLFSVGPAIRVWRQDLLPFLKPGEHAVAAGRSWFSYTLAALQLGFSVLLLTLAGLAVRSLTIIESADVGFDAQRLLIVRVNSGELATDSTRRLSVLEQLRDRLQNVPGVAAATYVRVTPPFGAPIETVRAGTSSEARSAERNHVGPGFFRLLGVPMLTGAEFSAADISGLTSAAVINQHLAEQLWPGQSALGRTMVYGQAQQRVQVVGVVPNALVHGFRREVRPLMVFLPEHLALNNSGRTTFYVRHSGPLETMAPAIREALRNFDASIPVESLTTMEAALAETTAPVRTLTTLLALFAVGSLLVAALGLYGILAVEGRRRTREFGVRIALGASGRQVIRSVLHQGAVLTAAGVGLGVLLSLGVATVARGLLFGVTPADPLTYLAVVAALTVVSLVASYIPARRASRLDPVLALRQE